MRLFVLAAAVLGTLAACSSRPVEPIATQTYLPDGRSGYSIQCNVNMSGCNEKAGEVCKGKGYEIVKQQQGKNTSIGFTGARSQNVYDVLVACKK